MTLALWGCSETPTAARNGAIPTKSSFALNAGANLDQWANGVPSKSVAASWQNGDLNKNNSTYAERRAVPFRLAIEGLTPGTHTIFIQYDWTAGGHKAYDYLASIDATEPPALANICAVGGGGRSTLCNGAPPGVPSSNAGMPSNVSFKDKPLPADPFVDPESGKTVDQAITDGAVARNLRIYGGPNTTITSVVMKDDPPVEGSDDGHKGPTTGNSTAAMLVTFVADGPAVLLTWSGHLAFSGFWNGTIADGAGQVTGAPWHMRTLNLDNGGAANQDRSIQPSAIVTSDANIQISLSGVNEVGTYHPMTGHVNINPGSGFVNAPAGTVITFTKQSGPGTIVDAVGSQTVVNSCTTVGTTGSCTVYLYSATTGLTTVNASTTVTVNGNQITKTTDGAGSNSGSLTKQWVDAKIDITPLSAQNPVGQNHVITATVQQDDGLPAGAPGDGADGFGPVPNGTVVTFSLLNNTIGASFVGGNTCTTSGGTGTCTVTITSSTAGTVTIHATTTFSINGESVTRATGTTGNGIDVTKTWDSSSLSVTKTGNTLSKIGDEVTYTFTIKNTGSASLTLTSIVDDKLGNLATQAAAASPSCSTLAAGAQCSFSVKQTIPQGASDPYVNKVDVKYGSAVGDATGSATFSVNLFQPSVSVTKSGSPKVAAVGQSVTYTFTITNTSSSDSPALKLDGTNGVVDNVIGNLTADAAAASPSCSTLAVGGSCSFTKSYTVLATDPDPLVNKVTVLFHPNGFPNNITADATESIDLQSSSISVTKTGNTLSKIGDQVTYTFTIKNTGSASLTLTSIVDDKLGDLSTQAAAASPSCSTLAAGAQCSFDVKQTIPQGASDPYVNKVDVKYSSAVGDATGSATFSVNLFQPSVSVVKSSTTTKAVTGQSVTYDFLITNTGSSDSPALKLDGTSGVVDDLIGNLTADAAAASPSCSTLAVGASCTFSKSRTVLANDPDPLINNVSVLFHPDGFPNNITGKSNYSVDLVHPSFTVAKTCTSTQPIPVGTASAWKVTVTNNGDVAIAFAVVDAQIQLAVSNDVIAPNSSKDYTGTGQTGSTGGAVLTNTATATGSVAGTSYQNQSKSANATCTYGTTTRGLIAPTATTCLDFKNGTNGDLQFLDANLAKNGNINNISPGVFFYYTEIDAPAASFTVDIQQSNSFVGNPAWPNLAVQQDQAVVYNVNCVKVPSSGAGLTATVTLQSNNTQVHIVVSGATVGAKIFIGVKYDPSAPIGRKGADLPVVYSYKTLLNNVVQSSNTDGITLRVKP